MASALAAGACSDLHVLLTPFPISGNVPSLPSYLLASRARQKPTLWDSIPHSLRRKPPSSLGLSFTLGPGCVMPVILAPCEPVCLLQTLSNLSQKIDPSLVCLPTPGQGSWKWAPLPGSGPGSGGDLLLPMAGTIAGILSLSRNISCLSQSAQAQSHPPQLLLP